MTYVSPKTGKRYINTSPGRQSPDRGDYVYRIRYLIKKYSCEKGTERSLLISQIFVGRVSEAPPDTADNSERLPSYPRNRRRQA